MTASRLQLLQQQHSIQMIRPLNGRNVVGTNNNIRTTSSLSGTKRNLFGAPDPNETKRMLEEQTKIDRARFLTNYGFDVTTEKFVDTNSDDEKNIEINERLQQTCDDKSDESLETTSEITTVTQQSTTNDEEKSVCDKKCVNNLKISSSMKQKQTRIITKPYIKTKQTKLEGK